MLNAAFATLDAVSAAFDAVDEVETADDAADAADETAEATDETAEVTAEEVVAKNPLNICHEVITKGTSVDFILIHSITKWISLQVKLINLLIFENWCILFALQLNFYCN